MKTFGQLFWQLKYFITIIWLESHHRFGMSMCVIPNQKKITANATIWIGVTRSFCSEGWYKKDKSWLISNLTKFIWSDIDETLKRVGVFPDTTEKRYINECHVIPIHRILPNFLYYNIIWQRPIMENADVMQTRKKKTWWLR